MRRGHVARIWALPSNQPLVRTPRSMTHTPSTDAQPADHFAAGPSWLLPEHSDRRRMVDMDRRLRPIRGAVFALLAVALLVSGPWLGCWTALPIALGGVLFRIADRRMVRSRRPETGPVRRLGGIADRDRARRHPHPRGERGHHVVAGDPDRHPHRPLLGARDHRRRRPDPGAARRDRVPVDTDRGPRQPAHAGRTRSRSSSRPPSSRCRS